MRKVIKILAKVLSTIILLSIFLPICITLLLSVDTIQNYAIDRASEFASDKLGARVAIDRIDLDLFSKVRVRGFYVEDYERDTLLYVEDVKARVAGFDIANVALHLEAGVVDGGCLRVKEMADGELNIRPIAQKLQRKDGKGRFKFFIDEIKVDGVEFSFERRQHRNPVYGVDYNDMLIRDINGTVRNLSVIKGVVVLDVDGVSAWEKSGFKASSVSTNLRVAKGVIEFKSFDAYTERSSVFVPRLLLDGENWQQYKHYIDSVDMHGVVTRANVDSRDIAYFAPGLRNWNVKISGGDGTFGGYVRDFKVRLNSAVLGESSVVEGDAHFIGMPDWRNAEYDVDITRAYITSADANTLVEGVREGGLPKKARDIVRRVGWADGAGHFKGLIKDFSVDGSFITDVGRIKADGDIVISDDGVDVSGDVKAKKFNLGRVLNHQKLQEVDVYIKGEAMLGDEIVAEVSSNIDGLKYGPYRYRGITMTGNANGGVYNVSMNSTDECLDFDLVGDMNLDVENPAYTLILNMRRADLHAIGVNKRDTTSVLSFDMGLEAIGSNIDNLMGVVSVANAIYDYPGNRLETDLVEFTMFGDDELRAAVLESEFADVQYQSYLSYRDAYSYIYNFVMTYIPLLYDDNSVKRKLNTTYERDDTMLKIEVGDKINDLLDAVASSLIVAPDTEAYIAFSPSNNKMMMRGSSETVEYGGVIMANMAFNVDKKLRDSLSLWLESSCIYLGARPLMPRFNITGGARENRASLRAGFSGDNGRASGMLGLKAAFSRDSLSGARSMHIDITPSHFTTDSVQWKLITRGIDVASSRLSIDELRITHPGQQLVIDGVVSRLREDSLMLTLDNFDISPLSLLVRRWGYEVEGRSNGHATIKAVMRHPEIDASIDLDSVRVNGLLAPPQRITSDWDFAENRARVYICDRITQDTNVRGYYQPKNTRYLAKADMKNLKLELIQPFLQGIVSDIEGTGDVNFTIAGQGRMAQLNGGAKVRDIGVMVDFTNTRYRAPEGELRVENNHIYADAIKLYDSEGHEGSYSMDLSLEHLSNVTYNISIEAKDMLVLDTKAKDNDLFYGHIYASGRAAFNGDKRGMKMNIEATSAKNSKFFMPLMGKENVSYADFVKFTEAKVEAPDTTAFLTRRVMAHNRRQRSVNNISGVMDMDMTLNVEPNIDMQLVIDPTLGDIIKAKGSGQITLHYVPKANVLEMRGAYTITEGNYLFTLQNIWHKRFDVEPGSTITWNGDPMAAQLNIDAIYRTKASLKPLIGGSVKGVDTSRAVPVNCYIKLTDNMMEPTVTFDVQVPNVAPEIQAIINSTLTDQQAVATQMFWLLAANTFAADDTGAMGASLSATTGFEMLSNQLSNWLSGDDYNVIFRYRPRTELTGDEVDFGFSKSWLNDRLLVEIEGGYLSDESLRATNRASNFVGEAFITWLIDDEGAFRLKGFTQTIDRYGENQGMQESGVGVYYSESFNSFPELWQSLKQRFTNAERRERRRERREERRERRQQRKAKKMDAIEGQASKIELKPIEMDDVEFIIPIFDTTTTTEAL